MKGKVRTRLLSALLTLAMLASMVPAAFAASWDDYGSLSLYADSDDEYYLIYDGDFDETDLYKKSDYFEISNDDDGPTVRSDEKDKNVEGDELWYNADEDEYDIADVYFDTGDYDYDKGYYDYTIYGYTRNGNRVGYMDIRLYVDNDSSSSSTDGDIYAETDSDDELYLEDISDEIYDYAYDELTGDPEYVCFTNWSNGTLYDGNSTVSSRTDYYFSPGKNDDDIDDLVFEAKDPDKESVIKFRVYSEDYTSSNRDYVDGTIVVNGDGSSSSSGDIKYSTAYNTAVDFKGSDFENLLSSSNEFDSVKFTLPSSSKGTLYWGNDKLTAKDELDEDDLDDVSFVPKSGVTGNVSISFKLYYYRTSSSKTTSTMSGTVVISIDDGTTINYTCEVDDYVEFDSDDFDDVCADRTNKDLDYVKFSLPNSSKGTLYAEYDGSSRGSTAAKSSDKFYVDPGRNDYGLDDVVFVPKTSGTVELTYTAYNTSGKSFTGKVKITTTAGTLSAINYTVSGSKVTFSASDFTSALKAKTSKSLSSVTFTLPKSTEGTLYYNGSTKVSSSTQYKASSSTNSLDKVSFVPASGVSGNVTIAYTAKDSSGNTYNGTVVVKTFQGVDTVLSYTTTGRAVSFSVSDFQNACLKKLNTTLSYVQFSLPSSSQGKLYYGYGTSQQTPVTVTSKYTVSTHLQYISFLPKAGFSGTATISYTGYDTAGASYNGTITVTVTPPTKSSYFTDATESWIAPAADFLYANNVYSGVVSGTTLGVRTQITRGEVMQMIYNAFNLKSKVPTVTSNFTDVPESHAYYTAINAGNALGIALGDQGKFRPNEPITRQDAMTLLYRAFTILGLDLTTGSANDLKAFGDYASVDSYATDALASMVKSGIIQGDNGNINPKGNLTRGEMSVILYRAMTL